MNTTALPAACKHSASTQPGRPLHPRSACLPQFLILQSTHFPVALSTPHCSLSVFSLNMAQMVHTSGLPGAHVVQCGSVLRQRRGQ